MSFASLPPAIRAIAENQLTPKQLDTWKLELAGWSTRRIATQENIARATVTDRLDGAYRTLRNHGVQQDASGNWTHKEAA